MKMLTVYRNTGSESKNSIARLTTRESLKSYNDVVNDN